ncbi:TetR family transcriptional regulator [Dyella sp. BiH032]|uniref:TetR/AcrR family transcriptional regulator n=1 Tax=Dyella sp. BiH032 TaxID=3075430 RepID=UPI0028936FE9|nr:TetR family transcriptional regulator [Dyella sp. BiH032]WNL44600.1 TetR family transcriptional regulator [Dyella sp. BiH032]
MAAAPKRPKTSTTPPTNPAATEREPRGARRKRETRQRLMEAALALMAHKGMEGVAINEITEAADVGFGSFYNHFESKEAIHAALIDWAFESFADALDQLGRHISDPAEVLSLSMRYAMLRAQREPLWGQFLIKEALSIRVLTRGLGQRLLRDIQRGIEAKRFRGDDPLMSFTVAGGIVLASLSVYLHLTPSNALPATPLPLPSFNADHLPERAATELLLALGLSRSEAEEIARRPLPPMNDSSLAARTEP